MPKHTATPTQPVQPQTALAEEVRTEKKLSHILQGNQKVSTTMSKIKLFLHVRERAGRLIRF